jgi:hypothetical protein
MGYSAQVQQSPNQQSVQSSGKSGPMGQIYEQMQKVSQNAPAAPNEPMQVGMSQMDQNNPQPMGKGGAITNSATSGQPRVGQPNAYPNTVGMGDNTQQQQPQFSGGKGKG